jgi:hypothetical protein
MPRVRALAALSVSALALLAAGCGGDGGNDADDWANDLCSAMGGWTDGLGDAAETLGTVDQDDESAETKATLKEAADTARSATQEFIADLEALEAPDVQAGAEAEDTLDQFAADLGQNDADLERAVTGSSTTAGAVTSITNILTTMENQLLTTFTQLEQLDDQGELAAAIRDSDECAKLR